MIWISVTYFVQRVTTHNRNYFTETKNNHTFGNHEPREPWFIVRYPRIPVLLGFVSKSQTFVARKMTDISSLLCI